MYVTAPMSGQRIILVWSLKKLICKNVVDIISSVHIIKKDNLFFEQKYHDNEVQPVI